MNSYCYFPLEFMAAGFYFSLKWVSFLYNKICGFKDIVNDNILEYHVIALLFYETSYTKLLENNNQQYVMETIYKFFICCF